jgi:hypothetical protein
MTAIMHHFRTVLANEQAMSAASKDAREVIRRVEAEIHSKKQDATHNESNAWSKNTAPGAVMAKKS